MKNLYEILLPLYLQFFSGYWLAIWCAPIRYNARWRINKEWIPVERNDTHWQALRITLRKGRYIGRVWKVIKKGTM